jgi:hypothetical protein
VPIVHGALNSDMTAIIPLEWWLLAESSGEQRALRGYTSLFSVVNHIFSRERARARARARARKRKRKRERARPTFTSGNTKPDPLVSAKSQNSSTERPQFE